MNCFEPNWPNDSWNCVQPFYVSNLHWDMHGDVIKVWSSTGTLICLPLFSESKPLSYLLCMIINERLIPHFYHVFI